MLLFLFVGILEQRRPWTMCRTDRSHICAANIPKLERTIRFWFILIRNTRCRCNKCNLFRVPTNEEPFHILWFSMAFQCCVASIVFPINTVYVSLFARNAAGNCCRFSCWIARRVRFNYHFLVHTVAQTNYRQPTHLHIKHCAEIFQL